MNLSDYIVSVDLGQVSDPTALCVLERRELPTGRMDTVRRLVGALVRDTVQPLTAGHYHVVHLERLPLGTAYTAIPDRLRTLGRSLQMRWRDEVFQEIGEGVDPRQAPIDLIVDQTGVGRPTVDILREAGCDPLCITITGGHEVTRVSALEYRVPKRDLVSAVNAAMQARRLRAAESLPDWPVLKAELANFRVSVSLAGHDSYAAGPAEDWRPGAHDDLVLALAMGVWWGEFANQRSEAATFDEVVAAWNG